MCEDDIDFLLDNPKERYKRLRLEATRQRTKRERRLAGMTKDIVLHMVFVFLLAIVLLRKQEQLPPSHEREFAVSVSKV